jgi:hypothetical protein
MSDSPSTKLLYRNAELETELRLVKEQLAQARQSTQYLLQLVTEAAAGRRESQHAGDNNNKTDKTDNGISISNNSSNTNNSSNSSSNTNNSGFQQQQQQQQRQQQLPQLAPRKQASKESRRDSCLIDIFPTAEDMSSSFKSSKSTIAAAAAAADAPPLLLQLDDDDDAELALYNAEIALHDTYNAHYTWDTAPSSLVVPPRTLPLGEGEGILLEGGYDEYGEGAEGEYGMGMGTGQGQQVSEDFSTTNTPSTSLASAASQGQRGFWVRKRDGTAVFIATGPMPPPGSSCAALSGPPLPELTGTEHRSLAGKAFVWVDMTPEELTYVIGRYARQHRGHSAEEYRNYFEDVIRPAYREKEKQFLARRGDLLTPLSCCSGEAEQQSRLAEGREQEAAGAADVVAANVVEMEQQQQQLLEDVQHSATNILPSGGVTGNVPAETSRLAETSPSARTEFRKGEYQPPRLHNPNALEDAKALQVEFQSSGATSRGRGRDRRPRPRETPYSTVRPSRHEDPEEDTDVSEDDTRIAERPEGGRRANGKSPRYFAIPFDTQELFTGPAKDEDRDENDGSTHRTVLISNIPVHTRLDEILDRIRGGPIYSAIYLDTARMRTTPPLETNTALITFISGHDARFVADHWDPQTELPITASLLHTFSRPIPTRVLADMQQHDLSRVMCIGNDARQLWTPHAIAMKLMRHGVRYPLRVERKPGVLGLMLFHFASLAQAKAAWLAFGREYAVFGELTGGFSADPCAEWVEKFVEEDGEQFEKNGEQFEKDGEQFEKEGKQFEKEGKQFEEEGEQLEEDEDEE